MFVDYGLDNISKQGLSREIQQILIDHNKK